MSKEREILQMFQTGMSQRNIALGLHVSRNTVSKVVAAYKSADIPNCYKHVTGRILKGRFCFWKSISLGV